MAPDSSTVTGTLTADSISKQPERATFTVDIWQTQAHIQVCTINQRAHINEERTRTMAQEPSPWIVLMPGIAADAPVYATYEGAANFAARCLEETAGNVETIVIPLERVNACVMACKGIETGDLYETMLADRCDDLAEETKTAQLLRDALEGVLGVMNKDSDGDYFICSEAEQTIANARAVVAKATGHA
jgi:hypothetical protein